MPRRHHLLLALILTAAVVIPRAYLLSQAHNESSDDDYHLVRGLEFFQRDRGLVHRELNDPPLGQAIAALPLWLLGGTTHGIDEGTALFDQQKYTPRNATTIIALWKAVLFLPIAAAIFLWCFRLYGPNSAWLALVLVLFDPTVAAHTHLASLDVLATGAIIIACYLGWRCFEKPTRWRMVAASLACAAALLTKHTAVLVPPVILIYGVAWMFRRGASPSTQLPPRTLLSGIILTLAFIWLLLMFDVSRKQPAGLYVKSIQDARRHADDPNDAYLLGEIRRGGWWYYFPVVASYKIPLATGLLLIAGLFSLLWRKPTRDELSLAIPALLYTALLLFQPIQIGWRHALPAYVPLIMLATRGASSKGTLLATGYWLLATLTLLDTTRHHPDYIAYVNRPTSRPYEIMSDSNLDWGQSLKQAARWIEDHPDIINSRPVYIRPFATARRAVRHYIGDRARYLRWSDQPPTTGILIVSPVALTGISESNHEYAYLKTIKPHHQIGRVLYVYDLDVLARRN